MLGGEGEYLIQQRSRAFSNGDNRPLAAVDQEPDILVLAPVKLQTPVWHWYYFFLQTEGRGMGCGMGEINARR